MKVVATVEVWAPDDTGILEWMAEEAVSKALMKAGEQTFYDAALGRNVTVDFNHFSVTAMGDSE